MKKRRKIRIVIGCLVILLVAAFLVLLIKYLKATNETYEDDLTTVERDLLIVTESYPTQFVVYGNEIDFDSSVSVKYIKNIDEEELAIPSEYKYQLIIINDLDSSINLSDEDWEILTELVKGDSKRNLFYLGDKEFDTIKELEIVDEVSLLEEGDLSIGFVYEAGSLVTVYGTYVKDAMYSLAEVLLHEQAYSIKMSVE